MPVKLKIKDIADIQIGYQFRKKIEPERDGTHQVIQIRDFDKDRNLQIENLTKVKLAGDVEKYSVNKGNILFLSRGQKNFAVPM